MKLPFVIFILFFQLTSYSQIYKEYYLPIVEDTIKFCEYCDDKYIVDKVWNGNEYIFTKIKSPNYEYELFRLNETKYEFRKYRDGFLLEKGNIKIDSINEVSSSVVSCYDCLPIQELIETTKFIEPIKVGRWEFVHLNGAQTIGRFNEAGIKIGEWEYMHNDTVIITDHDANLKFYSFPKFEILESNLNWLTKKFVTKFNATESLSIDEIFKKLDNRSWRLKLHEKQDEASDYLIFDFKPNGELDLILIKNNEAKFNEKLKWTIESSGVISLCDNQNNKWEFNFLYFGDKVMSLQKAEKER